MHIAILDLALHLIFSNNRFWVISFSHEGIREGDWCRRLGGERSVNLSILVERIG
jgi:hypothetical protein